MRVAIYARVSTKDKGQDPVNQLLALRAWCHEGKHRIIQEYIDHETGSTADRLFFKKLFEDASKRRFDLVLVWALDRFSREGMTATVFHIHRLEGYGIRLHSYTEPTLSTDNELTRDITLAMFASIAKAERKRISERTVAGLRRALASGKRLGRPPVADEIQIAVRAAKGGYRAIAEEYGISIGSVANIKRQA